MNKKTVLYIHHGKGLGGAPLSLLLLIKALDKTKYRPIVLFLHNSEAVDLYKKNGIEIAGIVGKYDFSHTKVWWFRWYHVPYLFRSIIDTIKTEYSVANIWLNKIKPDIVHLNTSSLIAWGKIAHKKGIPVVWHIREPLASGYFGLRRWVVKKYVEKYASKIIPICKHDALPWKDNPKTQVIYNAVDPTIFDFNIQNCRTDIASHGDGIFCHPELNLGSTHKILFLGGLSEEKGTLVILKAFEQVLKNIPNAQLLIAGYFDLDSSKTTGLKKLFPAHKFKLKVAEVFARIKNNVVLLGPIQNVPQAMAASDVVVFPATVGHFARPIIEAGFMKKTVVASNLAPLDELVIDNQTGFLIDPNDINLWAETLTTLLTDKALNAKMGIAGYDFCTRHFTIEYQIKLIEQIYETL